MNDVSYTTLIEKRIEDAERGALFVSSDFADIAPDDAVRKTLSRLVASDVLERPLRGIFRKPGFNEFLNEPTVSSPDQIAQALARKFNWSIAPAGDTALNMLGLDTQVPSVQRYVSDGPYRTYTYGPFTLSFLHTANKEVSALSPTTSLVIQALKARGKDALSEADLDLIASKFDETQIEQILEEAKTTTVWIREALKRLPSLKEKRHA